VYKEGIYDHMNFDKNYNYYHIMGHEEPHLVRRKQILAAHPEIKHLYGTEIATLWVAFTVNLA
jgi:sphingolipid delta-4 desaturase